MKKRIIIILALFVAYYGCDTIDSLTHFDVDYDYTFTLPALFGLPIPGDIQSPAVENDTESTFSNNDTRKDLVEGAILKKFHITLLEPADASFNFVDRIDVYIRTDDLDELLIGWKYDIPTDIGNFLELETSNSDLKDYLISDQIKVRLKTTSNKGISVNHVIDVKSTIEVDAKILGI